MSSPWIQSPAELRKTLIKAATEAPKVFGAALRSVANEVKTESMKRTPVDTGVLRASHRVKGPTGFGVLTEVSVEVGGAAADYAVIVHEDLTAHHDNGEAKFLENAMNAARPGIEKKLAEHVQRLTK